MKLDAICDVSRMDARMKLSLYGPWARIAYSFSLHAAKNAHGVSIFEHAQTFFPFSVNAGSQKPERQKAAVVTVVADRNAE